MAEYQQRAQRYHEAIRRILLNEWDPIGVTDIPEAQDEYDAYVTGVYRLLTRRAPESALGDYLWEIETEHMGLFGDRQHTAAIANKLTRLAEEIESGE